MDKKYLSDGRKVAVIGQLNNQETIVQEVFITSNGDEIPSGERFVVKSLHDEPVISYKDNEVKRLEQTIKELGRKKEELSIGIKKIQRELEANREIFKQSKLLKENMEENDFNILCSFMSGSKLWLVKLSYDISKPVLFSEEITDISNVDNGVRLISLMGRSNGDISYRVHSYSDGSGGSTQIYPFLEYEDAIEFIKNEAVERLNNNGLSISSLKTCYELGINFTEEQLNKFFEKHEKSTNEYVEEEKTSSERRINEKLKALNNIKSIVYK